MDFFAPFPDDRLLIAAHRGPRAERPENTRSAFDAALGRCDFFETDIQFSRDGVAVILHDETLLRTSDLADHAGFAGRPPRVDAFDLDELRRLDFGGWFLRDDPFGTLASGAIDADDLRAEMPQRIMTLNELLDWVDRRGMPVNLEIKDLSGSRHDAIAVPAVVEAVNAAGLASRVLLSSMNHDYLRRVRTLAPAIATAALQERVHPPDLPDYLRRLGVCAYHPEESICDAALPARLRRDGIVVNVFTVNDPRRQRALFAAGARAVFTDWL